MTTTTTTIIFSRQQYYIATCTRTSVTHTSSPGDTGFRGFSSIRTRVCYLRRRYADRFQAVRFEKPRAERSAACNDKGTGLQADGPKIPTRKEDDPDENPGRHAEKRIIRSTLQGRRAEKRTIRSTLQGRRAEKRRRRSERDSQAGVLRRGHPGRDSRPANLF